MEKEINTQGSASPDLSEKHTSDNGPVSKTLDPETAKAFAAADEELRSASVERIMLQNEDSDQSAQMAALLAKVAELEAQQVTLREAEQAAVRAAEARKGREAPI